MGASLLNSAAEQCAKKLEVWDQIRRTEEDSIEIGAMGDALLQNHGVETEWAMRAVATLSSIGA